MPYASLQWETELDFSLADSRTTASARTGTSQGSGAMDSASTSSSGRAGLWVVLRLSSVGLVGERGSKVPNASIGELSLEIEVALALDFEYARLDPFLQEATFYRGCLQTCSSLKLQSGKSTVPVLCCLDSGCPWKVTVLRLK